NLFEHQQPKFVASVQKIRRLRVVRCPHNIALQFPFQDVSIAALRTRTHRLADERERLVSIQTTQLDHFSVQLEAMIRELRLAKADTSAVFIEYRIALLQAHDDAVEIGTLQVPFPNRAQITECNVIRNRFLRCSSARDVLGRMSDDAIAVAQLSFQREGSLLRREAG